MSGKKENVAELASTKQEECSKRVKQKRELSPGTLRQRLMGEKESLQEKEKGGVSEKKHKLKQLSNLPESNRLFISHPTYRDKIMAEIYRSLWAGEVIWLQGESGVGKRCLTEQLGKNYSRSWKHIRFMDLSEDNFYLAFHILGKFLDIPLLSDFLIYIEAITERLKQEDASILFIFNHFSVTQEMCTKPEEHIQWRALKIFVEALYSRKMVKHHVLVTSRSDIPAELNHSKTVQLANFSEEEAQLFYKKYPKTYAKKVRLGHKPPTKEILVLLRDPICAPAVLAIMNATGAELGEYLQSIASRSDIDCHDKRVAIYTQYLGQLVDDQDWSMEARVIIAAILFDRKDLPLDIFERPADAQKERDALCKKCAFLTSSKITNTQGKTIQVLGIHPSMQALFRKAIAKKTYYEKAIVYCLNLILRQVQTAGVAYYKTRKFAEIYISHVKAILAIAQEFFTPRNLEKPDCEESFGFPEPERDHLIHREGNRQTALLELEYAQYLLSRERYFEAEECFKQICKQIDAWIVSKKIDGYKGADEVTLSLCFAYLDALYSLGMIALATETNSQAGLDYLLKARILIDTIFTDIGEDNKDYSQRIIFHSVRVENLIGAIATNLNKPDILLAKESLKKSAQRAGKLSDKATKILFQGFHLANNAKVLQHQKDRHRSSEDERAFRERKGTRYRSAIQGYEDALVMLKGKNAYAHPSAIAWVHTQIAHIQLGMPVDLTGHAHPSRCEELNDWHIKAKQSLDNALKACSEQADGDPRYKGYACTVLAETLLLFNKIEAYQYAQQGVELLEPIALKPDSVPEQHREYRIYTRARLMLALVEYQLDPRQEKPAGLAQFICAPDMHFGTYAKYLLNQNGSENVSQYSSGTSTLSSRGSGAQRPSLAVVVQSFQMPGEPSNNNNEFGFYGDPYSP